jgi:hypothetical protein
VRYVERILCNGMDGSFCVEFGIPGGIGSISQEREGEGLADRLNVGSCVDPNKALLFPDWIGCGMTGLCNPICAYSCRMVACSRRVEPPAMVSALKEPTLHSSKRKRCIPMRTPIKQCTDVVPRSKENERSAKQCCLEGLSGQIPRPAGDIPVVRDSEGRWKHRCSTVNKCGMWDRHWSLIFNAEVAVRFAEHAKRKSVHSTMFFLLRSPRTPLRSLRSSFVQCRGRGGIRRARQEGISTFHNVLPSASSANTFAFSAFVSSLTDHKTSDQPLCAAS